MKACVTSANKYNHGGSCKLQNFTYSVSQLGMHQNMKKNIIQVNAAVPGRVAQSVMCLATDASLTADPMVRSRAGPIL